MTLLTLSMPWQSMVLIFPLCLYACHLAGRQVCVSIVKARYREGVCLSPPGILWLYAVAGTIVVLAPVVLMVKIHALLCLCFLLRMTLMDALTGFLPREMTLAFLVAGLLRAVTGDDIMPHVLSATVALFVFGGWRYVTMKYHGHESPGLGDVFLATGIGIWAGGCAGLIALLSGVLFFSLWLLSARRLSEGDAMGPWLCGGAVTEMIITLYQPLITW